MLPVLDEKKEALLESTITVVRMMEYPVITPFWNSSGGGSQDMNTEVELTGVAITPTGGPVGTEESSKKQVNFNSLDDT